MRDLCKRVLLFSIILSCLSICAYSSEIGSADLDFNNVVDARDLLLFQEQWHDVLGVRDPAELVQSEILDVEIPEDNRPIVTYTLLDGNETPFDLNTPGLDIRWTIARITDEGLTNDSRKYVNYITEVVESDPDIIADVTAVQPTFDSGGEVTDLGNGQYSYRFSTVLEDFDPTLTHVVGGQIEVRDPETRDQITNTNPLFTFRPDGGEVMPRLLSSTETCNQCHNPLAIHGGGRKEYGLCVLCHTDGVIDPESGNSISMKKMIHKIHYGVHLPSVQAGTPYIIYGYRTSPHDYSEVVFPQDNRNCTTCHTGPMADYHLTKPSRAACGSCHDNVDFSDHMGGQEDDSLCSACHRSTGDEFGISVSGAHVVPRKSEQLEGANAEILSVSGATNGSAPLITFRLFDDAGDPLAPSDFSLVQVTLAGPTISYVTRTTERVFGFGSDNSIDNGDGTYSYQFQKQIAQDAEGTYAFGLEARMEEMRLDEEKEHSAVQESVVNPVTYVALDGGKPTERREVIDWSKCNTCHEDLILHGTLRRDYEYCVMCHNPMLSDAAVRPATAGDPVSVDFKYMIHKIHTGAELEQGYLVYGFGSNPHDYSHALFPGDRRDCESCHLAGTYGVPLPEGVGDTFVEADGGSVVDRFGPITAVCLSCHDSEEAAEHAADTLISLVDGEEQCARCHGLGGVAAFNDVHNILEE